MGSSPIGSLFGRSDVLETTQDKDQRSEPECSTCAHFHASRNLGTQMKDPGDTVDEQSDGHRIWPGEAGNLRVNGQ